MASGYTNTKRKRVKKGKPSIVKRAFSYIFALIASVAVLAAFNAVAISMRVENKLGITGSTPYGSIENLCQLEFFLEKYLLVNCNETVMETTRSVRVSGLQTTNGKESQFMLTRRLPDLLRLKLDHQTHSVTIGVNAGSVWQRIRIPNKADEISRIEGEEAQTWLEQTRFYDTIISTTLGLGTIESITSKLYEAKAYLEVSIIDPRGKALTVLVDPVTMYPYAEIKTLNTGELQTTKFSDFRDIDGMPTPFHLKTLVNDTLTSETVLETAEINVGVLSDYFEIPKPSAN
ncbi:MAG: hypothetical protein ACSHX8_02250 [Opitutaceae bacterium]